VKNERGMIRCLGFLLLAGVMLVASVLEAQSPASGWKSQWEASVSAAKTEGTVAVVGPPGVQWRQATMEFQKAFPALKVEFIGLGGSDLIPRISAERRGGKFLWDVVITGTSRAFPLKQAASLDPLTPVLILPEVLADAGWIGGFADGWMDLEKRFVYGFMGEVSPSVYVNREMVPEKDLASVEQLTDPKWRGKIMWNDPRSQGSGGFEAANLLYSLGEDFLTKLLKQDIIPTKDLRQQVDWIVRGKYPIAIGLDYRFLAEFQKQGVGVAVMPLAPDSPAGGGNRLSPGFGCVMLVNRAPHPAAARVFINWLMSREGQDVYVKETAVNSRRLDVVTGREVARPKAGIKPYNLNKEELVALYYEKAIKMAKELVK
jgi:iron(III) transport system substrate-binding protein